LAIVKTCSSHSRRGRKDAARAVDVWLSVSQRVGRVDGFEQVGLQAVDAG